MSKPFSTVYFQGKEYGICEKKQKRKQKIRENNDENASKIPVARYSGAAYP